MPIVTVHATREWLHPDKPDISRLTENQHACLSVTQALPSIIARALNELNDTEVSLQESEVFVRATDLRMDSINRPDIWITIQMGHMQSQAIFLKRKIVAYIQDVLGRQTYLKTGYYPAIDVDVQFIYGCGTSLDTTLGIAKEWI